MNPQDLVNITGQHLLFLGVSTYSWSLAQFQQAAQFAKAHGVDCLILKVADGTNEWYGGIGPTNAICDTIRAEGVGVIPYMYSYCNKFGALDAEIDIMLAYLKDCGVFCVDMEEEWNNQSLWAAHMASRFPPNVGTLLCSTWGDPSLQAWENVIFQLRNCVTVWMPQQYNSYLATFWQEFGDHGATWLQPTVNLTQDFGANDPVGIARAAAAQGHTAISVWYYDTAVTNPSLLDAVYAAFPKSTQQGDTMLNLTDPFAQQYFTGDDTKWHCSATNCDIIGGILAYYRSILGAPRLPTSGEQYDIANVAYQGYEAGFIVYDPQNQLGKPAGAGDCYMVMLASDLGQKLTGLQAAKAQITALQAQFNAQPIVADLRAFFALHDKIEAAVMKP